MVLFEAISSKQRPTVGPLSRKYIIPNFSPFPITGVIFTSIHYGKTGKKLIENAWYGPEKTGSRHLNTHYVALVTER